MQIANNDEEQKEVTVAKHFASKKPKSLEPAVPGRRHFRYNSLSFPIFLLTPRPDPLSPSSIAIDIFGRADPVGCSFCSFLTSRLSPVTDTCLLTSMRRLLTSQEGPPERLYDFCLRWWA